MDIKNPAPRISDGVDVSVSFDKMKIKIVYIIVLLGLLNFVNAQVKTKQPTFYTCIMHPEIHESKPGNCPKCGMALIKEKSKTTDGNNSY